jgi:SAM-dependent methyltransferase
MRTAMHQLDHKNVDPKQFWEDKIITWEEGRYEPRKTKGGLLEKIADNASRSLRYRIQVGVELLKDHVKGKTVLEVGCGSGIVAQKFIDFGATRYVGIDIAENAIKIANERKAKEGWGDNIQFQVGTIGDMPPVKEDIVFSLGVLDWLTDAELETLFQRQGKADFLHAIAEKRVSLSQYAHRAYVHVAYGRKTGAYRPRYFPASHIAKLGAKNRQGPFYAFRNPQLSFGALISSFPIGDKIDV